MTVASEQEGKKQEELVLNALNILLPLAPSSSPPPAVSFNLMYISPGFLEDEARSRRFDLKEKM